MGYAANREEFCTLNTDMYQLTMSYVWWKLGIHEQESTYYLHWRKPALEGEYTAAVGQEAINDMLNNFGFSEDDINFMRTVGIDENQLQQVAVTNLKKEHGLDEGSVLELLSLGVFSEAFYAKLNEMGIPKEVFQTLQETSMFDEEWLQHLAQIKLKLDVDMIPEGEVVTTPGPVIRVTGSREQCQWIETPALSIMNHNAAVSTRASRVSEAGNNHFTIADFSLRRSPTLAEDTSRASYIGGAKVTASLYHAKKLGIKPTGTMAHAYVMGFMDALKSNNDAEFEAFVEYLQALPTNSVLLVDTFDSIQGIENAIRAAKHADVKLNGIRLDSGDLYGDAWKADELLKEASQSHPELFSDTQIFMTDSLEERKLQEFQDRSFEEKGAPFPGKMAGIGTKMGNPGPFSGVYKISALQKTREDGSKEWVKTMKVAGLNPDNPEMPSYKASIPGIEIDTMRIWKDGQIVADIVVDTTMDISAWTERGEPITGVSLKNSSTEEVATINDYDKVEFMLKPAFRRNDNGLSEYVWEEPAKRILPYNGRVVTDLDEIQNFHIERRAALPPEVRRINDPESAIVLIDPRIHELRKEIIAGTFKPVGKTSGDLTADGGPDREIKR